LVLAMMSLLLDEVALAALRLADAGVESPRTDAELIAASVHNVRRGELHTVRDSDFDARFWAEIARRAAREPLQHITGSAHFRYLELEVGPGVFVPRPETELLADAVLPTLRATAAPVAVELCAGSGALALSLAREAPGTRVIAVERDPAALAWLARNAAGTGVEVVAGDLRAPRLLGEFDGRIDVVVCNPPYVPAATPVGPEVRHDPAVAVFAGADGMDLIPTVITVAARLLRAGGLLAIEHDESHQAAVLSLLDTADWSGQTPHRDLADRPRYVTAVRAR